MISVNDLLKKHCSDTCPEFYLRELEEMNIVKLGRGDVISKNDIRAFPGDYPVYSSSAINNGEMGRYSKYMFEEELITWSIDGGGKLFYRNKHRYSVTNVSGWLRVQDNDYLNIKYVYYYLINLWQNMKFDYITKAHPSVIREKYKIKVPQLNVQNEIVRILDNFTELEVKLEAELQARKKQFEYYRNNLLDFTNGYIGLSKIDEMISDLCPDGVKYVTLGEIGTAFFRGKGIKRDELLDSGFPCIRYGDIYTKYDFYFSEVDTFTNMNSRTNNKFIEKGDLLFAITGETIDEIGKTVAYTGDGKMLVGGDIAVMRHLENPKYLAYVMDTQYLIRQKMIGKVKSKVVHMSVNDIKSLVIPLPPLKIQNEIVLILDIFNEYVLSKTNGLLAEISARRKQYEYYRNKLLTF